MKHHFVALGLALLSFTAVAQQLTVSAAASLHNVFTEIGQRFEAAHPGVSVRFNFGASGLLLQQIEQGAPADVFASADDETMRLGIERKRLIAATRRDFAVNTLVLVAPAGEGSIQALDNLKAPSVKRIAIGKPATVPAGRYAQQALRAAGLWSALEAKLIPADNVRQVLDYVSRGEADAGFVYSTDAKTVPGQVSVLTMPVWAQPKVQYGICIVSASASRAAAQAFVNEVVSKAGQAKLLAAGFLPRVKPKKAKP